MSRSRQFIWVAINELCFNCLIHSVCGNRSLILQHNSFFENVKVGIYLNAQHSIKGAVSDFWEYLKSSTKQSKETRKKHTPPFSGLLQNSQMLWCTAMTNSWCIRQLTQYNVKTTAYQCYVSSRNKATFCFQATLLSLQCWKALPILTWILALCLALFPVIFLSHLPF